jgi:hypothetical protein
VVHLKQTKSVTMTVANTAWNKSRSSNVNNHVKKLLVNGANIISNFNSLLSSLSSCLIPGNPTGGNIKCEHYEL